MAAPMTMSMISKKRIREDFSNAAITYDDAAVVQVEICERTLERLQMLKLFPNAQVIACDFAQTMLQQSHCKPALCCDAEYLPIKNQSIDLIFSTSTFQWCEDLNQLFCECSRVLKRDGAVVFSTFGPDTLKELRLSWVGIDEKQHVHEFIDMHHIGDILLANHYQDPVVDREMIVLEYQTVNQLLADLKATGSRGKFSHQGYELGAGLTGKQAFSKFIAAYNTYRLENNSLPASYEVIYGYARKSPAQSADPITGEIKVPVDSLGK